MYSENSSTEGAPSGPSIHSILIIDDDPVSAEKAKQFFTDKGLFPKIATSGGQAYSALRMGKIDFVISKLILPDESGFEICDRIKRDYEWTPLLVWSEINLEASRQLAKRVRADGYLTRPADNERLFDTVKKIAKTVWLRYAAYQEEINHMTQSGGSGDDLDDTKVGMAAPSSSSTVLGGASEKTRKFQKVHFQCTCGHHLDANYKDRGRFIFCPSCQERARVPQCSDQEFLDRSEQDADASGPSDPMKFVTVRCQNCGTFFRLYGSDFKVNKKCPRCHMEQEGSLSIKGVPLSKAALASSMRLLRICSGNYKGKKILLPVKEAILGSGKGAKIKFAAPNLAVNHCTLKPAEKGVIVKDLGSEAGTWINGDRIEGERLLPPSGVLQAGALLLRLLAKDRSTEQTAKQIQKWSVEEDKASEEGNEIYRTNISVAAEAAAVIEMHWDVMRKKLHENIENLN